MVANDLIDWVMRFQTTPLTDVFNVSFLKTPRYKPARTLVAGPVNAANVIIKG